MSTGGAVRFREEVVPGDPQAVRGIIESSGFFHPEEVGTAVELVEERLAKGIKSGYYFIFAERNGRTVGYSCFGPIACTRVSYDLFWIAVHVDERGNGLGTMLLSLSEEKIARLGGDRVYIETSSRDLYEPTRAFYRKRGYREEAVLEDFYAPQDSKVVYVKVISGQSDAA